MNLINNSEDFGTFDFGVKHLERMMAAQLKVNSVEITNHITKFGIYTAVNIYQKGKEVCGYNVSTYTHSRYEPTHSVYGILRQIFPQLVRYFEEYIAGYIPGSGGIKRETN